MAMENVDAAMHHRVELLHEAGFDCAGEIEKYLKERSRTYGNTKTTRFQFHIAASVKGLFFRWRRIAVSNAVISELADGDVNSLSYCREAQRIQPNQRAVMIVKKLGMVSGGGFPGAGYNERKVAEGMALSHIAERHNGYKHLCYR